MRSPTTTSSSAARAQSPNHTWRRERYPLLRKIEYRIWWRRYPRDSTSGVDKITLANGIDFKFVDDGKAIISKAAGQAHVNDYSGESEQSDLNHYDKNYSSRSTILISNTNLFGLPGINFIG
jgi:hypothetical protein